MAFALFKYPSDIIGNNRARKDLLPPLWTPSEQPKSGSNGKSATYDYATLKKRLLDHFESWFAHLQNGLPSGSLVVIESDNVPNWLS